MATSPVLFSCYYQFTAPRSSRFNLRAAWLPVLFSLAFVCCTSTNFMSGRHTQAVVDIVWKSLFGTWRFNLTGPINLISRKVYHFLGYGMIGLIFRNAWQTSIRAGLLRIGDSLATIQGMVSVSALSVLSTFFVASLDELHQRFIPSRSSSFRDVMIDTTGAIFLNVVFWTVRARRRRKALDAQ
jgi:VanZ family protein